MDVMTLDATTRTVTMRRKLDETAYMSVKGLAEKLDVAPTTVYYWISKGLLKAERTGPTKKSPMRIPVEEVDRFVAEMQEQPTQ